MASALGQANQYSTGGGCPSNNESQNAVSLLQTKLHMNVPHFMEIETKNDDRFKNMQKGKMSRCMAAARTRPHYNGSNAEAEWLKGAQGQICAIAARPSQRNAASMWIHYSSRALAAKATFVPPDPEEDGALSHFVFSDHKEAIEPLHGYLRHPFANLGCEEKIHGGDIVDI